jgi:2-iminobutanoate/2-iminopropanoate deaminase
VLQNVAAILEAADSDLAHVLKTTVYVSDIALWDRVNAVYTRFFGAPSSGAGRVPTKELHHGFLVEIEAIACIKD